MAGTADTIRSMEIGVRPASPLVSGRLAGEGGRRPLAFVITPGQWGDVPLLIPVLERIRVPRTSRGHPRTRPDHMSGDKAYSSRCNRRYLRGRRIKHTILELKEQRANRRRRGSTGGRPTALTARCTGAATKSSGPSMPSKASGLWPAALTGVPTSSTAPLPLLRYASGSAHDSLDSP